MELLGLVIQIKEMQVNKKYRIELKGAIIGFTMLEKADAPMGVVFGLIHFENITSGYDLFLDYCLKNGIIINDNDIMHRFIDTQTIPDLRVFSENGVEVTGIGTAITGMDSEGFEINILGIPYPFYEDEFPHHVKEYREMFK